MLEKSRQNIDSALKRGNIFLGDGNWEKADEYFERVLDTDPENSLAYMGKMMIELQLKSIDELIECDESYKKNDNYIKAMRFADDNYINVLEKYENENIYRKAQKLMATKEYIEAIVQLDRVINYKDALNLKSNCYEGIYNTAVDMLDKKLFDAALFYFNYVSSFKNVDKYVEICLDGIEENKKVREVLAVRSARTIMSYDYNFYLLINKDGTVSYLRRRTERKPSLLEKNCIQEFSQWHNVVSIVGDPIFTTAFRGDGSIISPNDCVGLDNLDRDYLSIVGSPQSCMLALKKDGTISKLFFKKNYGQYEVNDWKNVVMISQSSTHTVGLKSDGRVVSTYRIGELLSNKYLKLLNEMWSATKDYSKEDAYAFLLTLMNKSDISLFKEILSDLKVYGDILFSGAKEKMPDGYNVSNWRDILSVKAGYKFTVGLKADGTMIASGDINRETLQKIALWHDIFDFTIDSGDIYGVTKSGKIISTNEKIAESTKKWRNITEVFVFDDVIVAYTKDGQVLCNDETLITSEILSNIVERIPADSFEKLISMEAENTIKRNEVKRIKEEQEELERQLKKQKAQEKRRKTLEEKQRQAEEKRKQEALKAMRRAEGICQYCGGDFKGFFTKKCSKCGKTKDY